MKNFTFWMRLSYWKALPLLLLFPYSVHCQYQAGKKALLKKAYPTAASYFKTAGERSKVLYYTGMANFYADPQNPAFNLDSAYTHVLSSQKEYDSLKSKEKEQVRKKLKKDRPATIRRRIEKIWYTEVMRRENPEELAYFLKRTTGLIPSQERAVQALLDKIYYIKESAFVREHAPADTAFFVLQKMIYKNYMASNWKAVKDTLDRYIPYFKNTQDALTDLYDRVSNSERMKRMTPIPWSDKKTYEGYVPVLSRDGNHMFFVRRGFTEDIYTSTRRDTIWSSPRPVTELNTNFDHEAALDISANGTEMLLFVSGNVFESRKTAKGWQRPTPLPAQINTTAWESDAHYFAKGLIFVSQKLGTCDIFISFYDSDGRTLQEPFPLGDVINTSSDDRSPFLHPDGKTLYFASNRPGGFGGYDIYMSTRLDSTWRNWSTPRNLGLAFNSEANEWQFTVTTDGEYAYSSIYNQDSQFISYVDVPATFKPDSVYTYTTKMLNRKGEAIDGEVVFYDIETGKIAYIVRPDPITGNLFVPLAEKKNYRAELRRAAAPPISLEIDFTKSDGTQIVKDTIIAVTTEELLQTGENLRINNLFFETGSHVILPESQLELDALSTYFSGNQLNVEIQGHTDDVGSTESNQLLSEKRANAVRDYLVAKGCTPDKIKAIGYGESRPLEPNISESGRQKNRRVEFRLL